jgi:hypothetical protein
MMRTPWILAVAVTGCSLIPGFAKPGTSSSGTSSKSGPSAAPSATDVAVAAGTPITAGGWCNGYKSEGDEHAKWIDDYIKSEGWSYRTRSYIAMAACDKPGDGARTKQIDGWRDQYMAKFALTENDFNAMAAVYVTRYKTADDEMKAFNAKVKKMSRLQRAPLEVLIDPDLCGELDDRRGDILVAADSVNATQLQGAAMVLECLPKELKESDPDGVACVPQLEHLDRAKFESEIASFSAFEKVTLREGYGEALRRAAEWKKHSDAMASTKEWKKVVIDAPAAGIAQWNAVYKKNKTVLDAAHDIEMKLLDDPDSVQGCSATMFTHFQKFFATNKPKDPNEAWSLLHNPIGTPLVYSLVGCQIVDGNLFGASMVKDVSWAQPERPSKKDDDKDQDDSKKKSANAQRLWVGPSTAGYWAAAEALGEVVSKQRNPRIVGLTGLPEIKQLGYDPDKVRISGGHYGTVKSIKKQADGLLVEFRHEKGVSFPEEECHYGHHIVGIDPHDGSFEYEYVCSRTGKTITPDLTEANVLVPTMFASGVQVGVTMMFYIDEANPKKRVGFPVELYADKKMTKLVGYMGTTF